MAFGRKHYVVPGDLTCLECGKSLRGKVAYQTVYRTELFEDNGEFPLVVLLFCDTRCHDKLKDVLGEARDLVCEGIRLVMASALELNPEAEFEEMNIIRHPKARYPHDKTLS